MRSKNMGGEWRSSLMLFFILAAQILALTFLKNLFLLKIEYITKEFFDEHMLVIFYTNVQKNELKDLFCP